MLIQCYYPGSFGIVVIFGKSVTMGRPFPLHIGHKSVPLVVDKNFINRKTSYFQFCVFLVQFGQNHLSGSFVHAIFP